jgi:hypothetical protein
MNISHWFGAQLYPTIWKIRAMSHRGSVTERRLTATHEAGHALVALMKGFHVQEISIQGFTRVAFPSAVLSPEYDQGIKHETKHLHELSCDGRDFINKIEEAFSLYSKPKQKKESFFSLFSYEKIVNGMHSSINAIYNEILRYVNLGIINGFQNEFLISEYYKQHEDYEQFKTVLNNNRIAIDDTYILLAWLKNLPKNHLYFSLHLDMLEYVISKLAECIDDEEHEHLIDVLLHNYDSPIQFLPCRDVIDVYLGGWAAVEVLGYGFFATGIGDDISNICRILGVPEYTRSVTKVVSENYYGQPTKSYGLSREEKLAYKLATAKDNLQFLFMSQWLIRRNLIRLSETIDRNGNMTGDEAKKLLWHVLKRNNSLPPIASPK